MKERLRLWCFPVNFAKFSRIAFSKNTSGRLLSILLIETLRSGREQLRSQHQLDETNLETVRGLIKLRGFHPSATTSRARRSDAATSDKDKQIRFVLMPRT